MDPQHVVHEGQPKNIKELEAFNGSAGFRRSLTVLLFYRFSLTVLLFSRCSLTVLLVLETFFNGSVVLHMFFNGSAGLTDVL